jgi:hypothetical protein
MAAAHRKLAIGCGLAEFQLSRRVVDDAPERVDTIEIDRDV